MKAQRPMRVDLSSWTACSEGRARIDRDVDLSATSCARDKPDDLVLGRERPLVDAVAIDGHHIEQLHLRAAELESRDGHVRFADVTGTGMAHMPRGDPEGTSPAHVEDRCEQWIAVKAWPAKPIDRTSPI